MLSLDGKTTSVLLTNVNGSQLIFGANNIADGDHQLGGAIASLPVEGMVAVDYFECVDPFPKSVPSIVC